PYTTLFRSPEGGGQQAYDSHGTRAAVVRATETRGKGADLVLDSQHGRGDGRARRAGDRVFGEPRRAGHLRSGAEPARSAPRRLTICASAASKYCERSASHQY